VTSFIPGHCGGAPAMECEWRDGMGRLSRGGYMLSGGSSGAGRRELLGKNLTDQQPTVGRPRRDREPQKG
jgi:hypothetical protein